MEREILTYPIAKEQVQNELSFFVKYFSKKGLLSCKILFGSSWGNEYYPSNEWSYQEIEVSQLVQKVKEVETSGIGALSKDDLFIKINSLEFLFCNDSDVHIYFTEANDEIEFFYARWKQLNYRPAEWIKNQNNGPGKRVRFN